MRSRRDAPAGAPARPATRRIELCGRCRGSFESAQLTDSEGGRLCAACAERAARPAAPRPEPPRQARREEAGALPAGLLEDVRAWCAESSWVPRLPALLLLAYWAFRHLREPAYESLVGALNFGIHELGHVAFAPFPLFLEIAGGSLLQCAAPVAAGVMFLRQRDYFAVSFSLGWLATNFYSVAVYAADARSQDLPLLGLGEGEPIHDWGYLLGELGLLRADGAIAALLRLGGGLCFAAALAGGAWLLWQMARGPRAHA